MREVTVLQLTEGGIVVFAGTIPLPQQQHRELVEFHSPTLRPRGSWRQWKSRDFKPPARLIGSRVIRPATRLMTPWCFSSTPRTRSAGAPRATVRNRFHTPLEQI